MKRRDLLEACKLADCTIPELNSTPLGQLATTYMSEKADGETDLEFDAWLDEDIDFDEHGVEVEGDQDPS